MRVMKIMYCYVIVGSSYRDIVLPVSSTPPYGVRIEVVKSLDSRRHALSQGIIISERLLSLERSHPIAVCSVRSDSASSRL